MSTDSFHGCRLEDRIDILLLLTCAAVLFGLLLFADRAAGSIVAVPLLTLAPLFWAGNFVLARAMRAEMPAAGLVFWRWAIAFIVLLPFVGQSLWRHRGTMRRHWRYILGLSASGIVGFPSLLYVALTSTTSMNALLMFTAAPVFIAPIAWLLLRERLDPLQIIGPLCSLAGAALIIARGDISTVFSNGL